MYQTLLTQLQENILTITINRADKLNALNQFVLNELDEVITGVYEDDSIKAVIITGAGSKAFVAGADIAAFIDLDAAGARYLSRKGQHLFFKIEKCPKPVVACINGFALGGGLELAMSCHIRIASENAKFSQPEINLGLLPGFGGTQRLAHLIGKGRALELLMTGNMISAATALQYGLINYVEHEEQLLEKASSLLKLIMAKSPTAIAKIIACVNTSFSDHAGFDAEQNAFSQLFETADTKEGVKAFLEKGNRYLPADSICISK